MKLFSSMNACLLIVVVTAIGCDMRGSAKTDWREKIEKLAQENMRRDRGDTPVKPADTNPLPKNSPIDHSGQTLPTKTRVQPVQIIPLPIIPLPTKTRVQPVQTIPLSAMSVNDKYSERREYRLVGDFISHIGPRYENCVAELAVDNTGVISGVICYGFYNADGRLKPCNGRVLVTGEIMSDKVAYVTISEVIGSWPSQLPNGVGVVLKGRFAEDKFSGEFVDPDRGNHGKFHFDAAKKY